MKCLRSGMGGIREKEGSPMSISRFVSYTTVSHHKSTTRYVFNSKPNVCNLNNKNRKGQHIVFLRTISWDGSISYWSKRNSHHVEGELNWFLVKIDYFLVVQLAKYITVDLILLHVGVIVDLLETNCIINTSIAIRLQFYLKKKSEKVLTQPCFKCAWILCIPALLFASYRVSFTSIFHLTCWNNAKNNGVLKQDVRHWPASMMTHLNTCTAFSLLPSYEDSTTTNTELTELSIHKFGLMVWLSLPNEGKDGKLMLFTFFNRIT